MGFDAKLLRRRGLAVLAAGLLSLGGAAAAGCGDDNNTGVDDQLETAADDAGNKLDQAGEDLGNAADDAGNKLDQAGEDLGNAADQAKNDVNDAVNGDGK